jgi:hypothetical protein
MQQTTASGNNLKSLQKDALQQMYDLMAQNQSEREKTLALLDEEIELTRESQQYSFGDKLASVMTLGLYAMVKEVYNKWEIEALQEEKKEIRMERLEDLKQLKEIRNALKDASDRAYSGNKWYIPKDRFGNLENLVKSSKMLDEQTRAGLTNYLDVMKDIEKNRIQEKNHSKILEKANENILTGNVGTGYGSFAEKRLNGLKDLAKDMLKTKGLSEEDRKFCEKLTNLTPESERSLKEKLENPNSFKNFDELQTVVKGLEAAPEQASNHEKKYDASSAPVDVHNNIKQSQDKNTLSSVQSQTNNQQNSQVQNSSQQKTISISYNPSNPDQYAVKKQDGKVTVQTKDAIAKSPRGKIVVLNQEKVSQTVKQALKAQGHDKDGDGIDDRKQDATGGVQFGTASTIKSNVQNSGVQQTQSQVR